MSAQAVPVQEMDRATYLGSSDIAAIMRVSKWTSRLDVFLRKTEPVTRVEVADPERARIFRRGHKLEPYIVEMTIDALRDAGHQVELVARNKRYRHPVYPFLAAELDAELIVDGIPVIDEAKSANRRNYEEWGEEGTDQIPVYYAAQVAFAQAITGYAGTWVSAIFGLDDIVLYYVPADPETNELLIREAVDFWHNHIVPRVPPEAESLVDLARMYRTSGPPPVEATLDVARAARRLMELRAEKKHLDEVCEQAEFIVASYMGESDTLTWKGKKILGYKHQARALIDAKRLQREQAEIYDYYLKSSVSRPILITRTWDGTNVPMDDQPEGDS